MSEAPAPQTYDWEALRQRRATMPMPSSVPPGMRLELLRAPLKPDKSERAGEWMRMINDRYDESVATLEGERVAFESIFFVTEDDGTEWIYHLVVHGVGPGGGVLNENSGSLDADHAAFSRECKQPGWELLTPQFFVAPEAVREAIERAAHPDA